MLVNKTCSSCGGEVMDEPNKYIECPFCKEDGFDLKGLKAHLSKGQCDAYNDIDISDRVSIFDIWR